MIVVVQAPALGNAMGGLRESGCGGGVCVGAPGCLTDPVGLNAGCLLGRHLASALAAPLPAGPLRTGLLAAGISTVA